MVLIFSDFLFVFIPVLDLHLSNPALFFFFSFHAESKFDPVQCPKKLLMIKFIGSGKAFVHIHIGK